jgi:Peptidase family M28
MASVRRAYTGAMVGATFPPAARAAGGLPVAIAFALLAGCFEADAPAPHAPPAADAWTPVDRRAPTDAAVVDRFAPLPDTSSAGSPDRPADLPSSPEGGNACSRPSPDQPWIRSYQDDLVARLSGARPLPGGGMLGVRSSAGARAATRQFLIDQLRDIGLVAQLHDYGSGQNVHVTLPATTGTGDHVVFGAHFDSVPRSPGANDNATGVAVVYSLARHLMTLPCRTRSVMFVLFDEEEDGLIGSAAFARKLKADGVPVHSVHTIDQMGWDMDGDRHIEVELPDTGLRELYLAAATDLGWSNPGASIVATNVSSTDHASFRPAFPAIGLTEEYRSGDTTPHYHKPTDTYPTVNLDYLKHATVLIHHVFADLVAPAPLFAHRVPNPAVVLRAPWEIDTEARHRRSPDATIRKVSPRPLVRAPVR